MVKAEKSKKARTKERSKKSSKKSGRDSADEYSESELDLATEMHPIGYYIKDRTQMIREMFQSLRVKHIRTMLPPYLKEVPVDELMGNCLDELEVMSKKRIRHIISGQEMTSSSESEESETDRDDDDDKESGDEKLDQCGAALDHDQNMPPDSTSDLVTFEGGVHQLVVGEEEGSSQSDGEDADSQDGTRPAGDINGQIGGEPLKVNLDNLEAAAAGDGLVVESGDQENKGDSELPDHPASPPGDEEIVSGTPQSPDQKDEAAEMEQAVVGEVEEVVHDSAPASPDQPAEAEEEIADAVAGAAVSEDDDEQYDQPLSPDPESGGDDDGERDLDPAENEALVAQSPIDYDEYVSSPERDQSDAEAGQTTRPGSQSKDAVDDDSPRDERSPSLESFPSDPEWQTPPRRHYTRRSDDGETGDTSRMEGSADSATGKDDWEATAQEESQPAPSEGNADTKSPGAVELKPPRRESLESGEDSSSTVVSPERSGESLDELEMHSMTPDKSESSFSSSSDEAVASPRPLSPAPGRAKPKFTIRRHGAPEQAGAIAKSQGEKWQHDRFSGEHPDESPEATSRHYARQKDRSWRWEHDDRYEEEPEDQGPERQWPRSMQMSARHTLPRWRSPPPASPAGSGGLSPHPASRSPSPANDSELEEGEIAEVPEAKSKKSKRKSSKKDRRSRSRRRRRDSDAAARAAAGSGENLAAEANEATADTSASDVVVGLPPILECDTPISAYETAKSESHAVSSEQLYEDYDKSVVVPIEIVRPADDEQTTTVTEVGSIGQMIAEHYDVTTKSTNTGVAIPLDMVTIASHVDQFTKPSQLVAGSQADGGLQQPQSEGETSVEIPIDIKQPETKEQGGTEEPIILGGATAVRQEDKEGDGKENLPSASEMLSSLETQMMWIDIETKSGLGVTKQTESELPSQEDSKDNQQETVESEYESSVDITDKSGDAPRPESMQDSLDKSTFESGDAPRPESSLDSRDKSTVESGLPHVESTLESGVEQTVESGVSQLAGSSLEYGVEQPQMESSLELGVEQTVESGFSQLARSTLESGLEQMVESGASQLARSTLESGIEHTVYSGVEQAGVSTLDNLQFQSTVDSAIHEPFSPVSPPHDDSGAAEQLLFSPVSPPGPTPVELNGRGRVSLTTSTLPFTEPVSPPMESGFTTELTSATGTGPILLPYGYSADADLEDYDSEGDLKSAKIAGGSGIPPPPGVDIPMPEYVKPPESEELKQVVEEYQQAEAASGLPRPEEAGSPAPDSGQKRTKLSVVPVKTLFEQLKRQKLQQPQAAKKIYGAAERATDVATPAGPNLPPVQSSDTETGSADVVTVREVTQIVPAESTTVDTPATTAEVKPKENAAKPKKAVDPTVSQKFMEEYERKKREHQQDRMQKLKKLREIREQREAMQKQQREAAEQSKREAQFGPADSKPKSGKKYKASKTATTPKPSKEKLVAKVPAVSSKEKLAVAPEKKPEKSVVPPKELQKAVSPKPAKQPLPSRLPAATVAKSPKIDAATAEDKRAKSAEPKAKKEEVPKVKKRAEPAAESGQSSGESGGSSPENAGKTGGSSSSSEEWVPADTPRPPRKVAASGVKEAKDVRVVVGSSRPGSVPARPKARVLQKRKSRRSERTELRADSVEHESEAEMNEARRPKFLERDRSRDRYGSGDYDQPPPRATELTRMPGSRYDSYEDRHRGPLPSYRGGARSSRGGSRDFSDRFQSAASSIPRAYRRQNSSSSRMPERVHQRVGQAGPPFPESGTRYRPYEVIGAGPPKFSHFDPGFNRRGGDRQRSLETAPPLGRASGIPRRLRPEEKFIPLPGSDGDSSDSNRPNVARAKVDSGRKAEKKHKSSSSKRKAAKSPTESPPHARSAKKKKPDLDIESEIPREKHRKHVKKAKSKSVEKPTNPETATGKGDVETAKASASEPDKERTLIELEMRKRAITAYMKLAEEKKTKDTPVADTTKVGKKGDVTKSNADSSAL